MAKQIGVLVDLALIRLAFHRVLADNNTSK